jgi:methyl-accepting chemotaxis protein
MSPVTTQKRPTSRKSVSKPVTPTRPQAVAIVDAIARTQAMIEFDLDGTILRANDLFCSTMGYRPEEIQGQHHRLFVDAAYAAGADYAKLWSDLRAGKAFTAARSSCRPATSRCSTRPGAR